MSDGIRDGMTKAGRLALAAAEAPILRNASPKTLARRVALVDKDGRVTGYASGREVLKGLARAQELEHVVEDGVRPRETICVNCGRSQALISKRGSIPAICRDGCPCATQGCHRRCGRGTAYGAVAKGVRAICKSCAGRESALRRFAATESGRPC